MKFLVYKNGHLEEDFKLIAPVVYGSDGIAIRRVKITAKQGLVICEKPHQSASRLSLLWPVDGYGKIMLSTTNLPERDKPYILNLEIARAKLMQIVKKQEDWSVFELTGRSSKVLTEAQNLFIQALEVSAEPEKAAKLADESLRRSVVFAEHLAIRQAESFFNAKSSSHGFSRGCLGCRVDQSRIEHARYIEGLLDLFGYVMLPIKWADIEKKENEYDFSQIDKCINILTKKKLAISTGPLITFSPESLPQWLLKKKKYPFEKIREKAYQFIVSMVSRYADVIRSWVVLGGLNRYNCMNFNFDQILEMSRASCMAVKSVSNRVLKIIEVSNSWGEYYAQEPNTIPPVVYIDMLLQSGVSFDAFGLKMEFGRNLPGMHLRDLMAISAKLDRFSLLGKSLYVTGLEIPSKDTNGHEGGTWHGNWDQQLQGQWLECFYKIALSKPYIDSVVCSNLVDSSESTASNCGLMLQDYTKKKSYDVMKRIHDVIFIR